MTQPSQSFISFRLPSFLSPSLASYLSVCLLSPICPSRLCSSTVSAGSVTVLAVVHVRLETLLFLFLRWFSRIVLGHTAQWEEFGYLQSAVVPLWKPLELLCKRGTSAGASAVSALACINGTAHCHQPFRAQELCESRGGHLGLLLSL